MLAFLSRVKGQQRITTVVSREKKKEKVSLVASEVNIRMTRVYTRKKKKKNEKPDIEFVCLE